MNKLTFILIFLSLLLACKIRQPLTYSNGSESSTKNQYQNTNFSDQATWVLGYFTPDRIKSTPHSEWYFAGYDQYRPDPDIVNQLTTIPRDNIKIKIVLGTWCPDSRREVPRFMKIIDIWKFPPESITFIGVDDAKLSPVAEYKDLDIQRVPTFILYKNNVEAGRIIENPVTSLEQDMLDILEKE
jgi:thiol-disulfide isomerase/thioredoxin